MQTIALHFLFFYVGERTFGVVTKLDLMDKGTNALDVGYPCLLSVIMHQSEICDFIFLRGNLPLRPYFASSCPRCLKEDRIGYNILG